MNNIRAALPTSESVSQLEPEDLAGYLLEHLASNPNDLHPTNFRGNVASKYRDEIVESAFQEAWAWLVRENLLVEKASSNGSCFISRRGQRLVGTHDFGSYKRSSILPKGSLHPIIAEHAWPTFIRGDYDTAVFQAFKEVEVAVRKHGFSNADLGVKLMAKAFGLGAPLADKSAVDAENIATLNLFSGAIGLFKNPTSHRHIALTDPQEAAEMISLASLLMRIVDSRI